MTQSFFVIEAQSGKKGKYVARETTVADFKAILEGKYDEIHEDNKRTDDLGLILDCDPRHTAASGAASKAMDKVVTDVSTTEPIPQKKGDNKNVQP